MRTPRPLDAALTVLIAISAVAQSSPKPDTATAAWWAQTVALSNDSMEGRDTGTEAYERAAKYVADQFKAGGLQPAGDNGTFFQRVPMHQIALAEDKSSVEIVNMAGKSVTLHFPTDVTTVPREQASSIEAPLFFLGYGLPSANLDLKGKIAVYFNNTPADLAPADRGAYTGRRLRALAQASVAAVIAIDNPSTGPLPTVVASLSQELQRPTPTRLSSFALTPPRSMLSSVRQVTALTKSSPTAAREFHSQCSL